jgi:hypothetical protein
MRVMEYAILQSKRSVKGVGGHQHQNSSQIGNISSSGIGLNPTVHRGPRH